ncbi:MAG: hypothetical protein ACRD3J_13735, partial [Thermoanaerobaculia bacterium]
KIVCALIVGSTTEAFRGTVIQVTADELWLATRGAIARCQRRGVVIVPPDAYTMAERNKATGGNVPG